MRPEKVDFAKDIPAEVHVSGEDFFLLRGRFLMFIEMIGFTAKDLLLPPEHEDYQNAASWLADPLNIQSWCALIDADVSRGEVIANAIRQRPQEISTACCLIIQTAYAQKSDFSRFMELMGIDRVPVGVSSLNLFSDVESMEFADNAEAPAG
jgi:hypothetical protein